MAGWSPDKTWREECGVFAAIGMPNAAAVVGLGLHALQHRGQESSGIVSCDERGEDILNVCELSDRGPLVLAFFAEPISR